MNGSKLKKYLVLAKELLDVVGPVVEGPNNYSEDQAYSSFMEGILRKSYFNFYCMLHLIETNDAIVASGPLIDLQRTLLEDTITVEWVNFVGPSEYAKRFWLYQAQEIREEVQALERSGKHVGNEILDALTKTFPEAKQVLGISKRGQLQSWRRRNNKTVSFKEMVNDLKSAGLIKRDMEKEVLEYSWKMGNEQNHPSPNGVIHYVETEKIDQWAETAIDHSLITGISFLSRIALSFPDSDRQELRKPMEQISSIRERLFSEAG